jgi:hypothetical protein
LVALLRFSLFRLDALSIPLYDLVLQQTRHLFLQQ